MNTAQFINILATQLRLNDRLRIFLYALTSLCTTKKCTLQLFDIQRMILNLSTDTDEKYITRMQVMKLFVALEKVQHQLGSKLVHFSFDDDNEDIVYIDLLFTEQYDNVITYAKSQIDKTKCDWINALTLAVNYYFPFELVIEVPRRPQPTYAKTKKKLEKVPNLFFELIHLGKIEGIDVDEIERELREIAAKINVDVVLICEQLEKWDTEQREILKKEQQGQKQNTQHTQQINLYGTNNEFTDISNHSQQPVKEYANELKQQYQNRPASRWYNLADNRIEVKNNNTRNNKQLTRNNINNNNIDNIDHSNNIKTNNSLANSHHVSHYT